MDPASLGYKLVAASDKRAVFNNNSDTAVMDLIDELQKFKFIEPDVWEPLNAIAQSLDVPIKKVAESILGRVSRDLQEAIRNSQERDCTKLLNLVRPFIHNTNFSKIFECIVSHAARDGLPDWFLSELLEIPTETILNAFSSGEARHVLFMQCRPLFHKIIYGVIERVCLDPMKLDMLLNSIHCDSSEAPKKDGKIAKYMFRLNIGDAGTLSKYHHEVMNQDDIRSNLLLLCCEDQGLYNELCCILRDLWERTKNPLLCALRLELGYLVETAPGKQKMSDPLHRFCKAVFDCLDRPTGNASQDLMNDSAEAVFIASDPMLRLVCFAGILQRISIRLSGGGYVAYASRQAEQVLLSLLCPGSSPALLEDTENYIEAIYLALEMKLPPDEMSKYVDALKNCSQQGSVINLVLFAAQHILDSRHDVSILEQILAPDQNFNPEELSGLVDELERSGEETRDERQLLQVLRKTGNCPPDICISFIMSQYLSYKDITGDHSTLVMALLVRWGRADRCILLYVLALLRRAAVEHRTTVENWMYIMDRLGYFADMSNIETDMVNQIRHSF